MDPWMDSVLLDYCTAYMFGFDFLILREFFQLRQSEVNVQLHFMEAREKKFPRVPRYL